MDELHYIIQELLPIGICVVLPIVVVWLIIRARINRDNMRKDIILAAMEKNSDIDVEEMMKKLNEPKTLLKEKQLRKLLIGSALVIFSVLAYVAMAFLMWQFELSQPEFMGMFTELSCIAVPSLAIGIAFLINYFVGKKKLAKEKEDEEQNLRQTRE